MTPTLHVCPTPGCGGLAPKGEHCAQHEPQRRAKANPRHAHAKHTRQTRHGINSTAAWRHARSYVLQRDGACIHCGSTHDLTAHHLDPTYTDPYNVTQIITLCRHCHGSIHGGHNSRGNRMPQPDSDTTTDALAAWFG